MSDWTKKQLTAKAALRMLRRACRARGVDAKSTEQHFITESRYRTDGITTLAVVTVIDCRAAGDPIYGYGTAVRAVEDEHDEHLGANRAIRRAMECASTVIAHRAKASRMRAELEFKLKTAALIGKAASRFEADAVYEVWRSGGDVDAVDSDRLHDAFHEGASSSEAAQAELARQRRAEQAYHVVG